MSESIVASGSHGGEQEFPRAQSARPSSHLPLKRGRRWPIRRIAIQTWKSAIRDRLFGHAAELGFYFLFALFPTLFSASSILGLAARSAPSIYFRLLHYLSLVIPTAALKTVLQTFNETTAAATTGKVTFGLIAAVWSASVGISALQDTLNQVYRLDDTRSYLRARLDAIGLTILISGLVTLCLSCLMGGDFSAAIIQKSVQPAALAHTLALSARLVAWVAATILLNMTFAVTYYGAPGFKARHWHWTSPGAAIGIAGWLLASLGLRIYLHFFNNYSVTYGSLGAVIILLTWFYITGLMILLGAEINSEIESAQKEPWAAQEGSL